LAANWGTPEGGRGKPLGEGDRAEMVIEGRELDKMCASFRKQKILRLRDYRMSYFTYWW